MSDKMAFLLFGDQSLDVHGFLAAICRRQKSTILAQTFIDEAGLALKLEVDGRGSLERGEFPTFRNIQQLNEKYHHATAKHAGIENALLCVAQLAHYMERAELSPEDVASHVDPSLVGLGTGLFAAAAVACAPSSAGLIPYGVRAVVFAFRLGCYVASSAAQLCLTAETSESWAYTYPDVTVQRAKAALESFDTKHVCLVYLSLGYLIEKLTELFKNPPVPSQAYISAVFTTGVEISGPPAILKRFTQEELVDAEPSPVPSYGPYRAVHLHSDADIDQVLGLHDALSEDLLTSSQPRGTLLSGSGSRLPQEDAGSLLRAIAYECLNVPIFIQSTFDRCVKVAKASQGPHCLVIPCGPTAFASNLAKAIARETKLDVILKMPPQLPLESVPRGIGSHGSSGKCKLAIVGMSGRFPDAASHEALWDLLCKGLDVHRVVPKERFPVETHVDPTGKGINTSHTPYGCFIKDPGLFDPRFFNMSPREALQTDPMQRLAITTAYEALEMSGYVPNRTPSTKLDRIGTFYGQTSDDWREINAAQEIDTYFITGGVRAFGPGRINYCFGFSGPSLNIDTACSSSAAALQVACTSLWAEECDTAVVGGLSVLVNPDIFSGLSRGQFLSKNGPCATFDNAADGYCRADGCASVIVKRLDDAIADKDNVLAVILGTATNHSADAISITHPHGPTQAVLSTSILDDAGVDPHDVDYVEMHGTGTQAGDGTEMVSVTDVFAPAHRKRPADRPLYLGAVKANIGHGEAASGVTALCKVLMMLQKNMIPPHCGIKNGSLMNVTFPKDLSERNVNIAYHMTPLRRNDGRPRRVFINNFSAAGGNTGLLLEDAPRLKAAVPDPRGTHVIAVTAKSKSSMIRNADRLVSWMAANPDTPVSHVAYTTTARRIQHYWRMNVTASSMPDAQTMIKKRLTENFQPISSSDRPNISFVFTGQGSHYAGMGKELYQHHSIFRERIDNYDRLCQLHGFPSILHAITGTESDIQSASPVMIQLGLCCLQMAAARLWASWGVKPDVVLGHSIGEYAALNVAGVLSASDAIYLVGKRAELLVEKCTAGTHAMLAVQGSVPSVTEALARQMSNIACINGPGETVLAGTAAEIEAASQQLSDARIKSSLLNVPFAFHSSQVDPILDEFEKIATSVHFQPPKLPIISPLLGKVVEHEPINASYLRNHAREAVNFLGGLLSAQSKEIITEKTAWVEIGPHPICSRMIKAAFGSSTVTAATLRRSEDAYKVLSSSFCTLHGAGLDLDWNEYHRDFAQSTRLLDLPAYSFDEKNYWIQYEGDWCLTKNRGVKPAPAAVEPEKPKLSTTSVHKVTKEEVDGDLVIIETETNLSRDDIRSVVTGHLCNGAPLCPSSLYADMAMTVSDYAYKLVRPGTTVGLNVANVEVPKTLIFDDTFDAHMLRCTLQTNVSQGYASIVFHTGEGAKKTEHAFCKVVYGDVAQWSSEFERTAYLIKSRIDHLTAAEKAGTASKIGRGLAYKLFSALVDYDRKYQGMEEVILDSTTCEATAKVVFQTTQKDGDFFFNPYWIDSCCHISGFIINGTDAVDSREQVFVSHGWGSMRFLEKLDAQKSYRSYIRMQPVKGTKMMAGDAYVFDGDRIVGIAGDVKFQSIPRRVLNVVLPPRGASAVGSARPLTKPSASRGPVAPSAAKKLVKGQKKQVTAANLNGVNAKLSPSVTTSFLEILTKEVGCDPDELADNIAFTDLGCDSLMALTVCGRMREELELDIDSHAFLEHSTVGAFKAFLAQFEKPKQGHIARQDSSTSSGFDSEVSSFDSETSVTTPLEDSDEASIKCADEALPEAQETLRSVIAGEMGVDIDEIIAAPDLAALGMDSLMSLTILGHFREKTGLDIPNDLFATHTSLLAVEKALGVGSPPRATRELRPEMSKPVCQPVVTPTRTRVINTHPGNTTASIPKPPPPAEIIDHYPHRKASSVLLQGSVRTASRVLFMVPDGSGCATSYTEIGQLSSDWAVWGMFSPFMKTPEEFNCGVYGMASKYIEEMKRRQPVGPYSLAGWSAGGVIAFEIVNQLARKNERVEHLIIIDAPCPVTIEPLPKSLHSWFASIGLLGEGDEDAARKIPDWLLPHFASSVTALSNYTAVPIPTDMCPKVTAIWCEDGVCKTPEHPRPDPYPTGHALFLLDNRIDFGPNRWDEYLDFDKIQTRHIPGNHFSMMHGELAKQLGSLMREALLS